MDATTLAGRSLVVIARRWFDRTYGNSYYTARVVVDGETVATVPFDYGHGDLTYLAAAIKAARAAGVEGLPDEVRGFLDVRDMRQAGWTVTVDEAAVTRRRDLHDEGKN
jgi:hypothetical protein